MTIIVLRILTVINALIGLGMVASAVWTSEPAGEKSPILVVIYLLWALQFLGLSLATFNLKPFARKWTIGLYGVSALVTLGGFVSDVITRDKIFVVFPWVSVTTYLLFFVFFLWPVIFMLQPGMKDYFAQIQESRRKSEEEAARASLRR